MNATQERATELTLAQDNAPNLPGLPLGFEETTNPPSALKRQFTYAGDLPLHEATKAFQKAAYQVSARQAGVSYEQGKQQFYLDMRHSYSRD